MMSANAGGEQSRRCFAFGRLGALCRHSNAPTVADHASRSSRTIGRSQVSVLPWMLGVLGLGVAVSLQFAAAPIASHRADLAETATRPPPSDPVSPLILAATPPHGRQYGKLPVLLARMNPDLAMGDELLKKTGAGNLFMVFGEPDVEIKKQKNGQIVAEIKGVDVYDPTTGQIRSASTDDIACWFIDSNYNGESFFVRHAYFTGADDPYDKLKRALRADIDEAAWSNLYSTVSRSFDKPESGKIAVKVINHYGDEVLKVFDV